LHTSSTHLQELAAPTRSPAQAQPPDELAIAIHIVLAKIGQEPTPTPNELEQTTSRVVISPVDTKMLREVIDACRQQGYLYLRRSRIALMQPIRLDGLCLLGNHVSSPIPFLVPTDLVCAYLWEPRFPALNSSQTWRLSLEASSGSTPPLRLSIMLPALRGRRTLDDPPGSHRVAPRSTDTAWKLLRTGV